MVDRAAVQFYAAYQPTEEDRAAIREFFEDERRAHAGLSAARKIAETDTTNERVAYAATFVREAA